MIFIGPISSIFDVVTFVVMWFVFAFSLFSLMLTKFHHYILPAVPPAAPPLTPPEAVTVGVLE